MSLNAHSQQDSTDVVSLDSGIEALAESPVFRGPVEHPDGDTCNDHLAHLYEDPAEQVATAVPFLRQGIERGERCMYVVDELSEGTVVEAMRDAGVDVDDALASGQLTFHEVEETYLRDGTFDSEEMVEFYAGRVEEATEEYSALRIAAETTWLQDISTSFEEFVEYEAKVNDLMQGTDCIAICHYDRTALPPDVVRDVIRTHPHLVYEGTVCHNFYYTPPGEFFEPDEAAREVERMMGTLLERTEARVSLQGRERFLRRMYDVTSDPALSFDEKLDALFDLGCEWFDLDLGGMARIDPETDHFEVEAIGGEHEHLVPGARIALSETYCRVLADGRGTADITDPADDGFEGTVAYDEFGVESYLGTRIELDSGSDRTMFFVTSEPREEPISEAKRTFLDLMGQWVGYELERKEREQFLREQTEVIASPERSFEGKLQALFDLGCEQFDLELGAMARVDPEDDWFEVEHVSEDHEHFSPGVELPLSETYCTAATEIRSAGTVSDPREEGYDGITVYEEFGIRAYLGTYVEVDGGADRTFFFVTSETRETAFTAEQNAYIELMGRWVKYELEQRQRETQLAALNEMSRDVTDAETRADIADVAVEYAGDRLNLPLTAVVTYDGETGELSPAAQTPRAADQLPTNGLCERDAGLLWDAFVAGQPRVFEDVASVQGAGDDITETVAVPLGRQGLFVTATTAPDGFSDAIRDFVAATAATVEAACTRADREQQLQVRERMLEEQNETLERLDRVNDIIRDIDQSLVQASTRADIEAVVCEQLAGAGPYEMAWFGEYDAVTEEVTPVEWAGAERGYLDEVTVTADDRPTGQGPAGKAIRTREPVAVNDILGDEGFRPWSQEALNRGYHGCVVLPLVYEEALYGIVVVYAGQPDVFGDLERSVLGELSDTIAHAINAVESKKALVTDEVTSLEFAVDDPQLEVLQLSRELDCTVRLESLVPRSDGGRRVFFSTRDVPHEDVLEFGPELATRRLSLVSEYEDDGELVCLFEADLSEESLAETVLAHGGQLESVVAEDGTATVTVELAADAAVREFVEMFAAEYPDSELVAQRSHERTHRSPAEHRGSLTDELTPRQMEALQTAYFAGYFEQPRNQSGSEVAETLSVSQPTFNSHLRSAQRKLCRQLFDEDLP